MRPPSLADQLSQTGEGKLDRLGYQRGRLVGVVEPVPPVAVGEEVEPEQGGQVREGPFSAENASAQPHIAAQVPRSTFKAGSSSRLIRQASIGDKFEFAPL